MERQVVITGMGIVTPNGIGIKDFWSNISNGVSFSHPLEKMQRRGYAGVQGCEINHIPMDDYFSVEIQNKKFSKKAYAQVNAADRVIQMGILAAKLALDDSGLTYDLAENNIGTYLGNAEEAVQSTEEVTEEVIQRVMRKTFEHFRSLVKPLNFLETHAEFRRYKKLLGEEKREEFIDLLCSSYGNLHEFTPPSAVNFKSYAIPGSVSSFFSLHGPSMAVNTACASGLDAIGQAYLAIKSGGLDIMLAGGSEAPITMQSISSLDCLGVISKTKPRPFSKDRDGFAISEGAGIVILEEKQHAIKRGARIYAEIKGYGQSIDANGHPCTIHPQGKYLQKAILQSLRMSELNPEQIDYINVHGTATKDCEVVETRAIKSVFGHHATKLNLSSTKSMTGHSIGAIGGIETIITALAIGERVVPPTINLENPDPQCDLNNTPNTAVERNINNSLVISMGFGGYNSALTLGEFG